jgi:flagellar export protein FliJ
MKKFRFRLQALLNYEDFRLQQAQSEVAAARRAVNTCENKIASMQSQLNHSHEAMSSEIRKGMDSNRFLNIKAFQTALAHQADTEENRRGQLEKDCRGKEKQLRRQSVKKKALENYKDRKQQDYHDKINRKIEKTNEEMVLLREVRKRPL